MPKNSTGESEGSIPSTASPNAKPLVDLTLKNPLPKSSSTVVPSHASIAALSPLTINSCSSSFFCSSEHV